MQQDRADEWAKKTYDVYCDVWQKQGRSRSSSFLRAVFARGICTTLRARANAIASEFTRFTVATAFPVALQQAHLRSLERNMRRMEHKWQRRIEIEAKECELTERISKLSTPTSPVTRGAVTVELTRQSIVAGGNTRLGRRPKSRLGRSLAESRNCLNRLWLTPAGYGGALSLRLVVTFPLLAWVRLLRPSTASMEPRLNF